MTRTTHHPLVESLAVLLAGLAVGMTIRALPVSAVSCGGDTLECRQYVMYRARYVDGEELPQPIQRLRWTEKVYVKAMEAGSDVDLFGIGPGNENTRDQDLSLLLERGAD